MEEQQMRKSFKIEVDCANCAAKIEDAICRLDGVEQANVNYMTQKLTLVADEDRMASLVKEAEKAGKKIDSDFELIH